MRGTKRDETKRRVAAGDQEVDRHMVHDVQNRFRFRVGYGVIGGADDVKKDDRRAEDRAARHLPGNVNAARRPFPHQKREHRRAEMRADDMSYRIGEFLAHSLLTGLFHADIISNLISVKEAMH